MYRWISIVLLIAGTCQAGWNSDAWPATNHVGREVCYTRVRDGVTNYILAKDVWVQECYTALVERSWAVNNTNEVAACMSQDDCENRLEGWTQTDVLSTQQRDIYYRNACVLYRELAVLAPSFIRPTAYSSFPPSVWPSNGWVTWTFTGLLAHVVGETPDFECDGCTCDDGEEMIPWLATNWRSQSVVWEVLRKSITNLVYYDGDDAAEKITGYERDVFTKLLTFDPGPSPIIGPFGCWGNGSTNYAVATLDGNLYCHGVIEAVTSFGASCSMQYEVRSLGGSYVYGDPPDTDYANGVVEHDYEGDISIRYAQRFATNHNPIACNAIYTLLYMRDDGTAMDSCDTGTNQYYSVCNEEPPANSNYNYVVSYEMTSNLVSEGVYFKTTQRIYDSIKVPVDCALYNTRSYYICGNDEPDNYAYDCSVNEAGTRFAYTNEIFYSPYESWITEITAKRSMQYILRFRFNYE